MTAALFDHLWQSTAVLMVICMLTLFFRSNGAHVRHALWIAASVKFLLPFALLYWLGQHFVRLMDVGPVPLIMSETLYVAGYPFSGGSVFFSAPGEAVWLLSITAWLTGVVFMLGSWIARWFKLRAALRLARVADVTAPMPVKVSSTLMEPGLVGIFRPVLLLPEDIADKLAPQELRTIIAHETCHLRRRDNLTAAIHMLVETLFWFWPPVWWLGARLIAERERACDEAVLQSGNDPQVYAESILKVCKHYVRLPLACAAGGAGTNLNHRMETIMENRKTVQLSAMKKSLLGVSAAMLVLMPVMAGLSPAEAARGRACAPQPLMQTHTLPPYPADSLKAKETGIVKMRLTIAPDGRVRSARIANSSGFARLDEAAVSYVQKNWLWRPVTCKPAQTMLKVRFALRHPAPAAQPSNP